MAPNWCKSLFGEYLLMLNLYNYFKLIKCLNPYIVISVFEAKYSIKYKYSNI